MSCSDRGSGAVGGRVEVVGGGAVIKLQGEKSNWICKTPVIKADAGRGGGGRCVTAECCREKRKIAGESIIWHRYPAWFFRAGGYERPLGVLARLLIDPRWGNAGEA